MRTEMLMTGEPEMLKLRRCTCPEIGTGQVRVRIEATGVSFAEQQMCRGRYFAQAPFPFVPGCDVVGIVEEIGEGVHDLEPGDRVAALIGTGGWADTIVLAAADLVPVPAGVSAAAAEAVLLNGLAAWRMLHKLAHVATGQTVVVFGATGGVGSTLVQMARLAGVVPIGIVTGGKEDAARRLGAVPVDRSEAMTRAREMAPGGVAAVFDHRGGPALAESWSLLAPGGTLVAYGVAAFRDAMGDPIAPIFESLALLDELARNDPSRRGRFFNVWKGRAKDPARFRASVRADLSTVFRLVADGHLRPTVAATFPLSSAAEALRFAESGRAVGKVILLPAA